MRWSRPSSSSREYFEISTNLSLTKVISPLTLVVATIAAWFRAKLVSARFFVDVSSARPVWAYLETSHAVTQMPTSVSPRLTTPWTTSPPGGASHAPERRQQGDDERGQERKGRCLDEQAEQDDDPVEGRHGDAERHLEVERRRCRRPARRRTRSAADRRDGRPAAAWRRLASVMNQQVRVAGSPRDKSGRPDAFAGNNTRARGILRHADNSGR